MSTNSESYDELCCYSLAHEDAQFIHQHVVDAFGAQDAKPDDKPIRYVFSLVGLYLHVEKGFTGREVQLAHMKLAQKKQAWPTLELPPNRGTITAATVLSAPLEERDAIIHQWCRSVWEACSMNRERIRKLLETHDITDPASVIRPANGTR